MPAFRCSTHRSQNPGLWKPLTCAAVGVAILLPDLPAGAENGEKLRSRQASVVYTKKKGGEEPAGPPEETAEQLQVRLETDWARYKQQKPMSVAVDLTQPAYVYLFLQDSEGTSRQIYPNAVHKDVELEPGKTLLPGKDAGCEFMMFGIPGPQKITAVAVPPALRKQLASVLDPYATLDPNNPNENRAATKLLQDLARAYRLPPTSTPPWVTYYTGFDLLPNDTKVDWTGGCI